MELFHTTGDTVVKFYPGEKTLVFVDGANLYSTAKALEIDLDYKKLLRLIERSCQLLRVLYYTAITEDSDGHNSLRPLLDWLDYNGYTMVTKPTKEFIDTEGRRKVKGNMDIEMAVDAMALSEHADHIVLFTGDGDFYALVRALKQKGKRVTVVSTIATRPSMASDELRREADQFIDLADLRSEIERQQSDNN